MIAGDANAAFEDLAALGGDASLPAHAALGRRATRELRRRVAYWSTAGARPSRLERAAVATISAPALAVGGEISAAALVAWLTTFVVLSFFGWKPVVFVCLVAVVAGAVVEERRIRRRSAWLRQHSSACRGCAYDLTGTPDAIPERVLGKPGAGPRRCPECGADWPRLLPPVPE